jgi:capsular polysaccharide transport system permease protein
MQGVINSVSRIEQQSKLTARKAIWMLLIRFRYFIGIVMLPTLLVASYYYIFASDQYVSEASYVVRKADSGFSAPSGLGQVLGMSFGLTQTQTESYVLKDYMLSHDAVSRLREENGLVAYYRRPEIDWLSRLWYSDPKPETLLKYYLNHVFITQDTDTGISRLSVLAFTPEDAYALNQKLLRMGEERINALNQRTFNDQVKTAREEYKQAEQKLFEAQAKVTALRQQHGDVDPQGSGRAQITLVTSLTGALVEARSRLTAMGSFISHSSPQYRALAAQVTALEIQIAGQQSRLAGGTETIATSLGEYEDLIARREYLTQRYAVAAAAYQQAQAEARKKQLYLVRVVDSNRPVKALYPERGRIVITVFLALFLAYAIGRMLIAGIGEHSL